MYNWLEGLAAKQLPQSDLDQILNTEYILWQQKELKLIYKNNILKYELFGKDLDLTPSATMPCVMQNRYIIQECNRFVIYEKDRLIKSFHDVREDVWECLEMSVEVSPKWVNFRNGSYSTYSYSYDKNRFYLIEEEREKRFVQSN